jgi:NitT/TauT family transport system substrate-binding protein
MDTKIKLTITLVSMILTAAITTHIPSIGSAQTPNNNSTGSSSNAIKVLNIGYFPNINHAQAVIGLGNGNFQKALGNDVQIHTYTFNAGPSAIEALLAKRIDVTYVGPNPAINGYVVSEEKDLRIISGASSGGAVFVVRNDSGIKSAKDFANKKFASPQLGNTQDVALRKYLQDNGYKTKDNGGNVEVIPVANPDILVLFSKKQIDGAWVPEPWATKLVKEANGRTLLDERDLWPSGKFVTANIVARTDYLQQNSDVIKKLLAAHVNETIWVNDHRQEAIKAFNIELKKLTGQTIKEDELQQAWSRIEFTYDPIKFSLFKSANDAYNLGFLSKGKEKPDLSGIFDLTILNEVLKEKGLATIETGLGAEKPNIEAIP